MLRRSKFNITTVVFEKYSLQYLYPESDYVNIRKRENSGEVVSSILCVFPSVEPQRSRGNQMKKENMRIFHLLWREQGLMNIRQRRFYPAYCSDAPKFVSPVACIDFHVPAHGNGCIL
jgi:hypothetical protein